MKTADLLTKLQHLANIDPDTVTDRELFNSVVEFEELMASVAAKAIPLQAAVMNRKAYKARKFRSATTGMANQTRLSARSCGRRFNQAVVLVNDLPRVLTAVEMGVVNPDQANLISQFARKNSTVSSLSVTKTPSLTGPVTRGQSFVPSSNTGQRLLTPLIPPMLTKKQCWTVTSFGDKA